MPPKTKELLIASAACFANHHPSVRDKCVAFAQTLSAYRRGLAGLQAQLLEAEVAEGDTAMVGGFHQFNDGLVTADRLSAEVLAAVTKLTRHIQRIEEAQAQGAKQ